MAMERSAFLAKPSEHPITLLSFFQHAAIDGQRPVREMTLCGGAEIFNSTSMSVVLLCESSAVNIEDVILQYTNRSCWIHPGILVNIFNDLSEPLKHLLPQQ